MNGLFLFLIALVVGFIPALFFVRLTSKSVKSFSTSNSVKKGMFSLESPPTETLEGKISAVSGEVRFQSRLATEPATLSDQKVVRQGELLATGEDGSVEVIFEDAAKIFISPESKLDFVQTLPEHLVVVEGEGSVRYQTDQSSGISVRALHALAEISRGADVELENEDGLLTIVVKKGSVKVAYNNVENVTTIDSINEGETYRFNDEDRTGEISY